jgi:thymidylate synthase (FAD)
MAKTAIDIEAMRALLEGYGPDLQFGTYLDDPPVPWDGAAVVKAAGQVCYASWGKARTANKDVQDYIDHLLESGHGSVLEHPNYSFLVWGISRSLTHELVRHRAGWAYSQLSQRYVSGKVLRFVERLEYQKDEKLHAMFEARIEKAAAEYEELAKILVAKQKEGEQILSAKAKTDLRKKVQQVARSILPNETETVIWITGNARSIRHVIEMRTSEGAETEFRELAFRLYLIMAQVEPVLFGDYRIVHFPDGTRGVKTRWRKV